VDKVLIATISDLYYDEGSPAGFSTLPKLRAAEVSETKTKKGKLQPVSSTKAWLEEQDAYTLHRPVRKRFARNPYTVTNARDVWECDLLDVQSYAKYNDNSRYILSVIDVFSKFLYLIPVKTKSGPADTSGDPYGYARIRARNFSIKTFRTSYATKAFSFKCAGTPT